MAIGLGEMFGFTFPENFHRPYGSRSIGEFWRRWHMSLSGWFRDYLFIPLGGSRGIDRTATVRNLAIVFAVTGLWHGAAFTFIVWGSYHGLLVIAERLTGRSPGRVLTFLLVVVGWVIFRAPSLRDAGDYLATMFSWNGGDHFLPIDRRATLAFAIGVGLIALPGSLGWGQRFAASLSAEPTPERVTVVGRAATLAVVLPVSLLLVAVGSYTPFLYFQF